MIRRLIGRLAVIGLVLGLAGCGENSPPPGAPLGDPSPVHGKVTFAAGTPLKGGIVTFTPVEVEVGSRLRYEGGALVSTSGEYKAGFNGDGKGLVPGEYTATVKPREIGEPTGSNSAQIPKAFREKSTSALKFTVQQGDNRFDIVLK